MRGREGFSRNTSPRESEKRTREREREIEKRTRERERERGSERERLLSEHFSTSIATRYCGGTHTHTHTHTHKQNVCLQLEGKHLMVGMVDDHIYHTRAHTGTHLDTQNNTVQVYL